MDMLLKIYLPETEICIESNDHSNGTVAEIYKCKAETIIMEHSLYTVSLWESIKHKAFLKEDALEQQDFLDYIRCMIISPENISNENFVRLTRDPNNIIKIKEYITDKKSASSFFEGSTKDEKKGKSSDIMTSDVMYYTIFSLRIPISVEHWHLNRLMTLFKVYEVKDPYKKKKRSSRDILKDYSSINDMRRKKLGTKG